MSANITDMALESLHASGENVAITLRDGGRLSGKVLDFDGYTVILSGSPDFLVYRHSIIKMIPASMAAPEQKRAPVQPQKPQARPPAANRQQKPRPPRPARQPRSEGPPPQKTAQGEEGFANPMAGELLKWLRKQEDGG